MIMIVEDNKQMRETIRKFVSKIQPGNEFIECSNGREAVEAYARHHPSLVLMDIQMKEMDGLRATAAIRRSFPDARIVIVTNFNDPDSREAAREAGVSGYVLKENLAEIRNFMPS